MSETTEISKPVKRNFSFRELRNTLLFVFALSFTFGIGYFFGLKELNIRLNTYPEVTINRDIPSGKETLDFSLFWVVWDRLNDNYFDKDKLIPAKMVYGAIQGMVSSVGDPYTVFLPPKENKIIKEDLKGSFDGVGIQIGYLDGTLAVIAPLPKSPAEKAGLLAGDYIIGIKDDKKGVNIENTQGMTTQEAVNIIRGEKGTPVTLTILREGESETRVLEVVRDTLDIPSIEITYHGAGENIARLHVIKFSAETKQEWSEAVLEVMAKPQAGKLILDLRNNPGGYMQGAVDLASDFLDNQTLVVTQEIGGKTKEEYKTEGLPRLKNWKSVILINKGSASASEILAGALRDQSKFYIIGDTSFGKGTIQEPQEFDDGSSLHVTIARWLTPSGFWVNDGGIAPDLEVKNDPDTEDDEQLQEAIKYLENL